MAKGLAAADLRTSTEEELELKLTEAKIELFNLRFQAATGGCAPSARRSRGSTR
jgi:ribosomal protein L29